MRSNLKILSVSILILGTMISFVVSCNKSKPLKGTPTSGDIKISVDESYKLLIDAEISTFSMLYQNATITPEYKPYSDVITDFINDSVQVAVANYKLTAEQEAYLRQGNYIVQTVTFAYDALALVISKENYDSLLTYSNIENIFKGTVTRWTDINTKSKLGKISVIFDNSKSGNVRYFKEKFGITGSLPDNFFAVNSNPEVIDWVSKNKNSLGIISVNWISNQKDSLSMSFVDMIRVVAVTNPSLDQSIYYMPYQGSIYQKTYPFNREVYLLSREIFAGLGSGFIAFVTGEKGQRIVLKSGLVPATMPIRLMQFAEQ
jgi:ABC-type phosphate transport system substrate-binding protein